MPGVPQIHTALSRNATPISFPYPAQPSAHCPLLPAGSAALMFFFLIPTLSAMVLPLLSQICCMPCKNCPCHLWHLCYRLAKPGLRNDGNFSKRFIDKKHVIREPQTKFFIHLCNLIQALQVSKNSWSHYGLAKSFLDWNTRLFLSRS